jgi:glycosyltransferase involved in cell wall biosynthesis
VDQKQQLVLIQALNELKKKINFKAVIIGQGKLKNILNNKIIEFNLSKKVKIINFQKNPYNILKKSDLLIHTAKYEGLPNVLLEALVLKKFIISSNCPTGPREILDNGKGGLLFKVGNFKELSKKIIYYKNNMQKLKKKIFHARSLLHRFDIKKNLNKYLSTVQKI